MCRSGRAAANAANAAIVSSALLWTVPTAAEDLTSASYIHRGGSVSAGASSNASSLGPRFGGSGGSIGSPTPMGFSADGALSSTAASGFWPIVIGALPSLDVDGDGIPGWIDDDDDDDGLDDAVETGTGTFVSPGDTGTSAVDPDSDGDGFGDGAEVAAGSDPNDPESVPEIPALPWPWLLGLAALRGLLARRALPQHGDTT